MIVSVSRSFPLKLPPGVRQSTQARFAFNTNGHHFAGVLEPPGSAAVQSIFDMQGQHVSSGSQSKLMLLSLATCYDPYNNLLWNYSPAWHAAVKWVTHPLRTRQDARLAQATADTIIFQHIANSPASEAAQSSENAFLAVALKIVAIAESKAVGLQDDWMTSDVVNKAAALFEYVFTGAIEKSLLPDAPAASPVMHFIAGSCLRSLCLLIRYGATSYTKFDRRLPLCSCQWSTDRSVA